MVMHPARRAGLEGAVLDAEGALGHVARVTDRAILGLRARAKVSLRAKLLGL